MGEHVPGTGLLIVQNGASWSVNDGGNAGQCRDSRRLSKCLVSFLVRGVISVAMRKALMSDDGGKWKMRRRLREIGTCRGGDDVSRRSKKGGMNRGSRWSGGVEVGQSEASESSSPAWWGGSIPFLLLLALRFGYGFAALETDAVSVNKPLHRGCTVRIGQNTVCTSSDGLERRN